MERHAPAFLRQHCHRRPSDDVETLVVGDANQDGKVDLSDVQLVQAAYGTKVGDSGYNPLADMNGDNVIDAGDLQIVDAAYAGADAMLDTRNPGPSPSWAWVRPSSSAGQAAAGPPTSRECRHAGILLTTYTSRCVAWLFRGRGETPPHPFPFLSVQN